MSLPYGADTQVKMCEYDNSGLCYCEYTDNYGSDGCGYNYFIEQGSYSSSLTGMTYFYNSRDIQNHGYYSRTLNFDSGYYFDNEWSAEEWDYDVYVTFETNSNM